jgi:putative ABC transport system substrate-binding protein
MPLLARAQERERMRRIGVLLPAVADDPEWQAWLGAFLQALPQLGWTIGRNVQIDTRWAIPNAAEIRRHAAELVALAPDVIVASGTSTVGPLLQATRTVPIVFPVIGDPVGAGFVDSLARLGGNATGFMSYEYSMGGKWVELLKQIAPDVTRVAVLRDATTPVGAVQFGVIQAVAPSLRVQVDPINMRRDAGEIERAVAAFAYSQIKVHDTEHGRIGRGLVGSAASFFSSKKPPRFASMSAISVDCSSGGAIKIRSASTSVTFAAISARLASWFCRRFSSNS